MAYDFRHAIHQHPDHRQQKHTVATFSSDIDYQLPGKVTPAPPMQTGEEGPGKAAHCYYAWKIDTLGSGLKV